MSAALVDRSFGFGFSACGGRGGRAATCGDDALDDNDAASGTTTGGESCNGGSRLLEAGAGVERATADIMARRSLRDTEEKEGAA